MGRIKEEWIIRKKEPNKKDAVYYYRLPGMKSLKSTGKRKKTEAQNYVLELLKQQDKSDNDGKYCNKTFAQYTKDFFDYSTYVGRAQLMRGTSPSMRYVKEEDRILKKYIIGSGAPFIGSKMKEIKREDIFVFCDCLKKKYKDKDNDNKINGIINDCLTVLSLVFHWAFFNHDIFENPMLGIHKLKEEVKRDKTPFTLDEYSKMFPINDEKELIRIWKTFPDFMVEYIECNTGMRNGEVRCLKWKNVDLENDKIYVAEAFKDENNKITGKPKNGKDRVVPISENLKKMLLLHKEKYTEFTAPDDYVCCLKDGRPLPKKHTRVRHKKGLEILGIKHKGQHVYRHTLNTMLIENDNKVDERDIREFLGWADPRIQANYTHLGSTTFNNFKNAIGAIGEKIA